MIALLLQSGQFTCSKKESPIRLSEFFLLTESTVVLKRLFKITPLVRLLTHLLYSHLKEVATLPRGMFENLKNIFCQIVTICSCDTVQTPGCWLAACQLSGRIVRTECNDVTCCYRGPRFLAWSVSLSVCVYTRQLRSPMERVTFLGGMSTCMLGL